MADAQRETVIRKVEQHLRKMSRQLIKIDTEGQALQYLSDSFRNKLYCDFVGVVFVEEDLYVPKTWSGNVFEVRDSFPMPVDQCSNQLLEHSLTDKEACTMASACHLFSLLKKSGVKTWFTVPIKDELHTFGFCMIGFLSYVPLLEMRKHFDEFGQDVALAITMTRNRKMQLKEIEGIEWITKNLSIDSPFEEKIAEITTRAGKGTDAEFACIYLYNDLDNCFIFQPPAYGQMKNIQQMKVQHNYFLKEHFPFLEKTGGMQLTIPISMDLKTIGVLHVEKKRSGVFSEEDLHVLRLISNHIATILENARLYNKEKENRNRLHFLLEYQQALVKETVKHEGFDGITSMLGELFNEPIVLFDRFMHPLSFSIKESKESLIPQLRAEAEKMKRKKKPYIVLKEYGQAYSIWPISGGDDVLGYLAVRMSGNELDDYDQIMIEMARNICSIQFIKQKLVLDATEQAKENFISKLLVEMVENKESILQYANLFMWDLFRPHRVALLSITLKDDEVEGCNLLEQQAKKSVVWDYIRVLVVEKNKEILAATFKDQYVLIVPANKGMQDFWTRFYTSIKKAVKRSGINCHVFIGIGGKADNIQEYYVSSEHARQALNIVQSRFRDKGYAFFEELGSYTILHHLEHTKAIHLFMENQLGPLEKYSEGKSMDLIHTLRVYLVNNGNAKATAQELYIHRSSLLYRLEKIESILEVDLNDPEVRFNLMMAFKLYDMRGQL
ncbi:PucR family transcriptional regulator [Siminovitchia terrae]|uniref:PucR family transcriptional regulator n=1 Tax=Siminovitchia terrae TaxID=1914933 RepID=A0A429X2L6_SIMTE|nr:helix-turn-helix domain-containing protein [Siminovitchia terrae]RST57515.1 PucR family transcriptional regulator [Siminovitchia terrae]